MVLIGLKKPKRNRCVPFTGGVIAIKTRKSKQSKTSLFRGIDNVNWKSSFLIAHKFLSHFQASLDYYLTFKLKFAFDRNS